jgi:hypothetical protein
MNETINFYQKEMKLQKYLYPGKRQKELWVSELEEWCLPIFLAWYLGRSRRGISFS